MKFSALILACIPGAQDGAAHNRDFWRSIVDDGYAVPAGENAHGLLLELNGLLDETDEELRDGFGYGIPAAWILRQKLFSKEQLKQQVERLSSRLELGLGRQNDNSVLGRSFAALNLSVLVARDLQEPFLNDTEFERLLAAALGYMAGELDLRGRSEELGWIHSTAHVADLLKFIGRHPRLDSREERARVFQGLAKKIVAPSGLVFVFGEDERLALSLLSLLGRHDFAMDDFEEFRRTLHSARDLAQPGETFSSQAEAAKRNARNVLRVLLQLLRAGRLEDIDRAEALEERILGSLSVLA